MKFKNVHSYLIVLVFCIVLFGFLSFYSPELYGNDSFFHIKISELMVEKGIIHELPWMQYTELNKNFVDKHFLYHVYLMPFTLIGNLAIALKIANLILILLSFLFLNFLLKQNKVKHSELWVIAAMTSSSYFIYRLLLGRAITLGIIFIILGIYLIQKNKLKELFFLSFVFVWSYAAFPILPMITIMYSVGVYFSEKKINGKIFASSLLGTITGIIINPYFPKNILLGFRSDLRAATLREAGMSIIEWSSFKTWDFFTNNLPLMYLLIIIVTLVFIKKLELDKKAIKIFFPTIYILILNLKSIRLIDFFAPIQIIFSSIALNSIISEKKYFKQTIVLSFILLVFCSLMVFNAFGIIEKESKTSFKECAEWLEKNTMEKEIVFLWQYDDFPKLFYHNTHNYYTEGLDSYYLKDYNKDLFELKKKIKQDLNIDLVKTKFNSRLIFIEKTKNQSKEINKLKTNKTIVHEWSDCAIIELK